MPLMLSEVYDAFKDAGASEDKSRSAAAAIAGYENRLISIESKIDRVQANVDRVQTNVDRVQMKVDSLELLISHTRVEMRTLFGVIMTIALSILWRVWH